MEKTKKAMGLAGSALLLASMTTGAAVAVAQPAVDASDAAQAATEAAARECAVHAIDVEVVNGTFSYEQGVVTPTAAIARAMNGAAKYLCGSAVVELTAEAAGPESVSITGAVAAPFAATLRSMADEGEAQVVMGCACAGNPVDGLSSVNADVTGITIDYMMARAGVSADANTVVFTSADGYEVALPLEYVMQRPSLIVYAINGEEMTGAVGGVNQLWLGSTSARYFVRNVETIAFETRAEVPPVPGTEAAGDTYANVPNIGIQYGGAA